MGESPLEVHCSGLGGGLLSSDRPYDIFLQNYAQIKVYGPSLAMTDNWDAHVTQIGLTKSVHEYAVYQLLSTAEGWQAFLSITYAHPQMLLTRAIRQGLHMPGNLIQPGLRPSDKSSDVTIHRGSASI